MANLATSLTAALIAIFVVPRYVKLLGVEQYGLIALYFALRGFLQVLDLGIGTVVNREFARHMRADESPNADVLRTFEGIYWIVALAIGLAMIIASPAIAQGWLKPQTLSIAQLTSSVRLIGIVTAIQWPTLFYQNALLGQERHVVLNAILVTASLATHIAAVMGIVFVSPQAGTFFICAMVASAAQIIALALAYRRGIQGGAAGRFHLGALRHLAGFATAVVVISVSGTALGQIDKVLLSRFLPLATFGYYSLATIVAGALLMLTTPIFSTLYPRFSALVAGRADEQLGEIYHFGAQLVTVAVIPPALIIIFFAQEIIAVWTRSADTALHVAPIAAFLTAGAAFNALMILPYALQLAHGWTRLAATFTVSALVLYVPALAWVAAKHGPVYAAALWLLMNLSYFVIVAPPTHRRLLPDSFAEWLLRDIALPASAALVIVALSAALVPASLVSIAATGIVAAAAAAATATRLRRWLITRLAS